MLFFKEIYLRLAGSSTPTEKMFIQMGDIMQEIINEVKEDGVQQ